MFGSNQLVRIWTPHIGPGFASQLASAFAPLRLLIVVFPMGWAIGIVHAFSGGSLHTLLGALNAAVPVALLGIVMVTAVQLRRLRNAIRRALSNRGFESATRPRVLNPSRFRSWLVDAGVPPDLATEILIEEGRPSLKSRATDHV
ncbi:hypothetical protein [Streptomyces sp. L7]|uniref:hypothetical protein n=1 Tax=Streptomyces sp. L7 TaxID=3423954 RepID=UPI003D972F47